MRSMQRTQRSDEDRVLASASWHGLRRTLAAAALLMLSVATSALPCAAQARPDLLAASIDSTVSAHDDFFQYADGGWLKRHPIPDDASAWGITNVISEMLAERLRRVSEGAAAKKAPRGSLEQLVGDFWSTGMDSVAINRQRLTLLRPDLARIDRIRSVADLVDVVADLNNRGQFTILRFDVSQDEANSGRWVLGLSRSGIAMGGSEYGPLADPQRMRLQAAYREYLFRTFRRLGQDSARARASADTAYALEARIARGFGERPEYRRLDVAALRGLAPTIDWGRYLRRIGAAGVDSVVVRHPGFYRTLDSLLRTTSADAWKPYLKSWLVRMSAPYLDDETFGDRFALDRIAFGVARPQPRWQRVLAQARNAWLARPLTSLYADAFVPASVMVRHRGVAETFRAAFRERIAHLDWMEDSTKRSALRKLDRLRITMGRSGEVMDFSTMPLRRDAYVLNVMRAGAWYHDLEMKRLRRPVDRRTASEPRGGLFWTAGYNDANNEVLLHPGPIVMIPGWRDDELDDAVVYGATSLGHEISHAFDSEGRRYDADGNKADWWTAADDSAFRSRAQVLIDEYDAFEPLEGVHVNGRTSLRENMADLVGLRIALDAFKKTEQFKKGERISGFTPLQRFFLAYAYGWGQERPEYLATMLRAGAYAPSRERVNGVVANIPEFYEAFGIKPGDRMYRPESARAKIW